MKGHAFRQAIFSKLTRDTLSTLGRRYAVFLTANAVVSLLSFFPLFFLGYALAVGETVTINGLRSAISELLVVSLAVAVLSFFAVAAGVVLEAWGKAHCTDRIRKKLVSRLHELSLEQTDMSRRGEWLSQTRSELSALEKLFSETIPRLVRDAGLVLALTLLFLIRDGWWGLAVLMLSAFGLVFTFALEHRLSPLKKKQRIRQGAQIELLIETLEGLRTLRSHFAQPFTERRFCAKQSAMNEDSVGIARQIGIIVGSRQLLTYLLTTVLVLAFVAALALGKASFFDMAIFVLFATSLQNSVGSLALALFEMKNMEKGKERLRALMADDPSFSSIVKSQSHVVPQQAHTLALHDAQVSFLSDTIGPVTASLKRGEMWAITGRPGSGKSTFLEAIAGLRGLNRGGIRVHDAMGFPMHEGPRSVLSVAAYVEQRPYLFEGTLRDNLLLGNRERLSDAALWNALERAQLYHFVQSAGGLDAFLRERGVDLTQGERYQIALCRALLLQRPFLILDEPFSHLDDHTIRLVIETLEQERRRSCIIIGTRLLPRDLSVDGRIELEDVEERCQSPFRPERYRLSEI